jgi:hypothetical protein
VKIRVNTSIFDDSIKAWRFQFFGKAAFKKFQILRLKWLILKVVAFLISPISKELKK